MSWHRNQSKSSPVCSHFNPQFWAPLWHPACASPHLKSLYCKIACVIPPPPPCDDVVYQQYPSGLRHFSLPPLLPSPPTVFRRLSARPPSLLLPRWKVSHPEPRPRWPCWAQAPPCWPGMEARTWRVLRTRPQPLALPACRMTSVGSSWREMRC